MVAEISYFFWSCWPMSVHTPPPPYTKLLTFLLFTPKNSTVRPYCWRYYILQSWNVKNDPFADDTIYFNHGMSKNQAAMARKLHSLLAGFYNAGRYSVHYQWRRLVISLMLNCIPYCAIITCLTRHVHWYNSGMNALWVSKHSLIGFSFCFPKWNSYLEPILG